MKKIIPLLLAAFTACDVSAQIDKGTFLIGASSSLGYNNLSPDNSSGYNILNVDLKGGYFLINNLALGVDFRLLKVDDISETSIGAFGRYYVAGKFFVGAGFSSIIPEEGDSSTEIPLEVGFAAFVANNFAIEPSVSYATGDGYERFGLNIGITLYPGR
jgi:hypothetical protein